MDLIEQIHVKLAELNSLLYSAACRGLYFDALTQHYGEMGVTPVDALLITITPENKKEDNGN